MNLVGEHKEDFYESVYFGGYNNYQMYICPVCGKVTLNHQYWNNGMTHLDENGNEIDDISEEIIFPVNSISKIYLPESIRKAYEAALKIKKIDAASCLMALRRTLEITCNDKGANGKNLWNKIEDLSNKGTLPPQLKHASTITKTYGNIGAHEEEVTVSDNELNYIIEFVKYILDYLYVLPQKLDAVQKKMQK